MKKIKIVLDAKSGIAFYRQIIQQIELAISLKKYIPGDKLPTVRALAIELKVNPNTVAKAYSELEIRGLVNTQVGSGTFISKKEIKMSEIERKKKIDEICAKWINQLKQLGVTKEELLLLIKNYKEA